MSFIFPRDFEAYRIKNEYIGLMISNKDETWIHPDGQYCFSTMHVQLISWLGLHHMLNQGRGRNLAKIKTIQI